jgi:GNAT superfamily N-acetyltransferase
VALGLPRPPPPAVLDRLSVDRRAAYWQQWLADAAPRRRLWLVVEQDRPVGFVAAGPSRDPDAEAATGEVHALYLEREVVGTGVGRALCARAVDRLRHDGFREGPARGSRRCATDAR